METFNRELAALQDPTSSATRIARATRFLAEYGITAGDEQLAALMQRLRAAPGLQSIESDPAVQRLQVAVLRFVNQANQDPSAVDKPRAASMPEYAHLYGLMSFLAAFHRNFVSPTATLLARAARERDGQLLYAALAPVVLIAVAQLTARMAQFLLTGRGDDDELKRELVKDGPFGLPNWVWWSVSSSSMLGMYDPLLQAFVSVRYNKPVSDIMLGPALAMPAKLLQAGVNLTGDRNSPNTTTAEFRAAQATYDALLAPLLMQALLRSPYAALAPQPVPFLAGIWLSKSGVGPVDGPRKAIPEAAGLKEPERRPQ
ncbi:MAG: hypothetical protein IT518_29245 [Burkholderiales bacterium]|nr:hypothetical protein [Burkholderiales bacterium]